MLKGIVVGLLVAVVSCAASEVATARATSDRVTTVLRDKNGEEKAQAKAAQMTGGVQIIVTASAMPAGTYGVHVHTIGRCEAPDFASASGHWNPTKRQHGTENPDGSHMGDMPNLVVGSNGKGSLKFTISGASLRGGATPLLDGDGAAVIIHASADDYRTDPSGNSGARLACGILG